MSLQTIVPPLRPPGRRSKANASVQAKRKPNTEYAGAAERLRKEFERAIRDAGNPLLGTAIGRMKVHGVITGEQFGAAEAYGRLRGRFDRAMGMPRRSAKSPCYGDAVSYGARREMDERALLELKSDHVRLLATTRSAYPILDRVILDDAELAPREVARLRNALDRLVVFFRIGQD